MGRPSPAWTTRRAASAAPTSARLICARLICAVMFCLALRCAAIPAGAAEDDCRAPAAQPDAQTAGLAAVEERLVLRLADDRQLRLAGVDPVGSTPEHPGAAEDARGALARLAAGERLSFVLLDGKPDRWGRRAASVSAAPASAAAEAPGSLAEAALLAGLGRYLAEPAAHPCRRRLLAAEDRARTARAGLWADAYYAVLAPTDRAAFAELSATMAIVQGRLTQVVPGPYRTELRFAPTERRDVLSASIPPRVAKSFKDQGVDLPSLIGRTIRVRGLLDLRFGPRLELSGPDALEVLASAEPR